MFGFAWVLWVVIWVGFAIFVGGVASEKGRSNFVFFLLSIIFSPLISLIIVHVISPVTANVEAVAIKSGNYKKCPKCAELVKKEALVCKHCQAEFDLEPEKKMIEVDKADLEPWKYKQCFHCAELLPIDALTCDHCKAELH